MSKFAELADLVADAHDEQFADDYEYRPSKDDEWSPLRLRRYRDRIENKRTATGWNRVSVVDFCAAKADLEKPQLHGHIRLSEGEPEYTITEFTELSSSRWIMTCQRTSVGEISRAKLRGG